MKSFADAVADFNSFLVSKNIDPERFWLKKPHDRNPMESNFWVAWLAYLEGGSY